MNNFHGWLRSDAARPTEDLHSRMSAPRPAHVLLDMPPAGLAIAGDLPHGAASVDAQLAAVIDGQPRWMDSALARLAAESGDCAALKAAYQQAGRELFRLVSGSFAFAIIDRERRTLLAAVDRMGIEPLCYAMARDGVVFGRSAQAVAAHPDVGVELDPQSVYDYLYFHVVPSPQTILQGVHKLEPGQLLEVRAGQARLERYWQCAFAEHSTRSEHELSLELLSLLDQAVREQSRSSATGAFLSGGIDSSTVAGLLSRAGPGAAHTFTIGFAAEGYDEMDYARITARHFQTRQHEFYLTPEDVATAVPRIAAHYDEPFGNSSAVPAFYCARLAREHGISRMLAGDGGDELFGGNSRYAKQNVFEWYLRAPAWLRLGLVEPALRGVRAERWPVLRKARSYVDQANVRLPDRLQSYNYFSRTPALEILHPELLAQVDLERPLTQLRSVYNESASPDPINRMLYLDWKFTLADNDLRKVSRMCELAGVEVRYPWLDSRVVDLSMALPGDWKVRGRQLRYFVKRALRGFLPAEVLHKPKHGFGLPFGLWMRTNPLLRELAHDSLANLRRRRLVRADYVDELERRHREEHAPYFGEFIWVLMMLEQWLQQHAARQATSPGLVRDAQRANC